jgi:hypothetical protein
VELDDIEVEEEVEKEIEGEGVAEVIVDVRPTVAASSRMLFSSSQQL